jgi:acetyl-CoA acetyltransferase
VIGSNETVSNITGLGRSDIGRRLGRDPLALATDACLRAIADAGLDRKDIDGAVTYPGSATAGPRGYVGPGVVEVQDALRLELDWSSSGLESTGPLGPVFNACAAVSAGLAKHVLCFCTVWEATARAEKKEPYTGARSRVSGSLQWTAPFRAYAPVTWIALHASRYFHEFGTTRAQLGQIALNGRRNAERNPAAIYREPMSLEQYLAAPIISSPLCLFDCDIPADGCVALIVSAAHAAKGLRRRPIRVEAIGCAMHGRPSWDQRADLSTMAMHDASRMLWKRTSLRPSDVGVAQIYDGFSILTLMWLEALGFCPRGQAAAFVEGGSRIALDGKLPINTDGGQLSAGRLNGYGLLHEACVQLWEEGGDHQIARSTDVGLVAVGGGPYGGCMVLVRD